MQIHTHTCSTFIHTHTHTYTNRARRFCYDVQAWSQKHIVQTSLFDGLCPPDHLPLHVAFLPDVSLEFTWKSGHSMPHARCLILAYSGSKAESQAINATWEGRQLEQFHTWVSRGVWKVSQQMLKHDLFLALGSRRMSCHHVRLGLAFFALFAFRNIQYDSEGNLFHVKSNPFQKCEQTVHWVVMFQNGTNGPNAWPWALLLKKQNHHR